MSIWHCPLAFEKLTGSPEVAAAGLKSLRPYITRRVKKLMVWAARVMLQIGYA